MNMNKALNQYAAVKRQTGVEDKNPHELILMLYDATIEHLSKAKGCIIRKEFAAKGEAIGRVLTIIGGLQTFLDMEQGGEVSKNLDALYDYCTRRLYDATSTNDVEILDEIIGLIREIREGWAGIHQEAVSIFAESGQAN
jgi:flagellar protein FliS